MANQRKIKESPWYQGEDEQIAYTIDTSPWGGSPSSLTVVLKDGDTDVSGTKLSGSASAASDTITTPVVQSLTAGKKYRLEVKWTDGNSNVLEAWGEIIAEE